MLHSGEPVASAVDAALSTGAQALLFNCSAPEFMTVALTEARAAEAAARAAAARAASAVGAQATPAGSVPPVDGDSDSETAASDSELPKSAIEKLHSGGSGPHASLDGRPPLRFGAYANVFTAIVGPANEVMNALRLEVTPELYAEFAAEWTAAGATILGGCCGVGPDHIRAVAAAFAA